jgi:hypothetical protein
MRTITASKTGLVERPVPREWHAGCGKRPEETARSKDETALRAYFTTACFSDHLELAWQAPDQP